MALAPTGRWMKVVHMLRSLEISLGADWAHHPSEDLALQP